MYNEEVDFLEEALMRATGSIPDIKNLQFISGGLVNQTVFTDTSEGKYFIKFNEVRPIEMFETEAKGLQLLREALPLTKIPEVIYAGKIADRNFLVLSYHQEQQTTEKFWQNLGRSIASLHQTNAEKAGLSFDNFNGPLTQKNTEQDNWVEFFFEKRLRAQFGLAYYNNIIDKNYLGKLDQLEPALEHLYEAEPFSLLHGDFWRGNIFATNNQQPCIFDSAVYFGHREVDITTAKLFGGFNPLFFETYQEAFPLQFGAKERMEIYSLYPLMIYVNLYGTSYLNRVDKILDKYC